MNHTRSINATAAAVLAIVLATVWTTETKANNPSLVSMEFDDCGRVVTNEVYRILEIELRSIANGRKDVTAKPAVVRVRCDGAAVHLEIDYGAEKTKKTILATDRPEGEDPERLIALTAAELVLLSWVDIQSQRVTQKTPDKVPPSSGNPPEKAITPPDTSNKQSRNRFASFELGALWEFFTQSRVHLFGGTLSLVLRPIHLLVLRAAVGLEGGSTSRTSGDVKTLATGAAAFIGLEKTFSHLSLIGEAGMRAGYGWLKGIPNSGTAKGEELGGSLGGPVLCLRLASVTKPSVGLSLEGGYALWGVTGRVNVGDAVGLKGFHLGVMLSIGYP